MMALLIWEMTLSFSIPAEQAPTPQMLLLLPGINPLIPLSSIPYLIVGVIIAIIVHEFSHGILAMVGNIKIKALGILYMIIPLGAFVEPDEKQMEKIKKKKRMRIFAMGPSSNLVLAFICALIFSLGFMASLSPHHEGTLAVGIIENSPPDVLDIEPWTLITSINEQTIQDVSDFDEVAASLQPTKNYTFTFYHDNNFQTTTIMGGMVIAVVAEGYPADNTGIRVGDIIKTINGTLVKNEKEFNNIMNSTRAGKPIYIEGARYQWETEGYTFYNKTVTLGNKYEYYERYFPDKNKEEYKNVGFLGINILPMGILVSSPDALIDNLIHPTSSLRGFFTYITLPFQGLSPFPDEMSNLYKITGPLSKLPKTLFWGLGDSIYWIFWLNFALGTFNALPAIPLDGGYLLKDGLGILLKKINKNIKKEQEEKIAGKITFFISLMVLALILSLIIIPRFMASIT
jgi:membrane-associated protease RseP (regulator of RpoE activity)